MTVKDEIAPVIPHGPEEGAEETFVEKTGLEKEKCLRQLRKFFESQPLAVLSTQNGTAPYANLVAFASTEKLTYLLFSTTRATGKYSNLLANPEVSLLIDNRKNTIENFQDVMAVTARGKIEPIEDFELSIMEKIYLMKHPYLTDFLHTPTTAFLKIRIEKYIIVTSFQHIAEVSV